jgi:myo-inositol catabolism protein IolC
VIEGEHRRSWQKKYPTYSKALISLNSNFDNSRKMLPEDLYNSEAPFHNEADSLWIDAPLEVPGQPPVMLNVRCKVLELTNEKLVVRYKQIVPFTNTLHTITETYNVMP